MRIPSKLLCVMAVSGVAAFMATTPAQALTNQECSAKYQQAKKAGTLGSMKWNDFRKAQCGATATPTAAAPTTPAAPTQAKPRQATAPTAAPATVGNAVFPSTVNPKYSSETAGKARMETCLDQYRANKTSNGNGGLKWIQTGGGYYSECNKRLKGAG